MLKSTSATIIEKIFGTQSDFRRKSDLSSLPPSLPPSLPHAMLIGVMLSETLPDPPTLIDEGGEGLR